MPDNLDELLSRLATGLVADAPEVVPFDQLAHDASPPRGRSPHPRQTAVVVAVALVVVAIVVGVFVSRDASDREEPAGRAGFEPCTISDPGSFVGPNGQTFGPTPTVASGNGGTVYPAALPDYIPVVCKSGTTIGGWIKTTDMLTSPSPANPSEAVNAVPDIDPVYSNDGTTIVGHMVSGEGFVPLKPKRSAHTEDSVPNLPAAPATSYGVIDDRHLVVSAPCASDAMPPTVVEKRRTVSIRLRYIPSPFLCLRGITIALDAPLGTRHVIDATTGHPIPRDPSTIPPH